MGTPFSVQGALRLPGAPGQVPVPHLFGIADSYDSKVEYEYVLPDSAGSKTVEFGTLPVAGAKFVLVTLVALEEGVLPAPITLTVNGGADIELSAGGFFCLGSPAPETGITSLSFNYTGAGRVFVLLLG